MNTSQNRNDSQNQRQENRAQNTDLETKWNTIENDYRAKYPNLTDNDVNYRTGEFDSMTENIARRTNRSREDVNNEIRNWNH